jgi:hypothetical protein
LLPLVPHPADVCLLLSTAARSSQAIAPWHVDPRSSVAQGPPPLSLCCRVVAADVHRGRVEPRRCAAREPPPLPGCLFGNSRVRVWT